jgi:hypothetical protein
MFHTQDENGKEQSHFYFKYMEFLSECYFL